MIGNNYLHILTMTYGADFTFMQTESLVRLKSEITESKVGV